VDKLKAQVEGAKWNLDKTVERAPSDGYVTNVELLKGARVANLPLSPVMALISTAETVVGVQIQQIYTRYIEPDQEVEVTFKFFPARVFTGKVISVLEATATGQVLTSGTAVAPGRSRRHPSSCGSNWTTPGSQPASRPAPTAMRRFTPHTSSRRMLSERSSCGRLRS
jgi:multidrug efflux pump subunit AcrA (membrane-fusion protein)